MSAIPAMRGLPLLRALQLASQALPIGGYSHSHGLEAAIEAGIVRDETTLLRWTLDLLHFSVGAFEVSYLLDFYMAWERGLLNEVIRLNEEFLATRESAELRAASVQMGYSMHRLLLQMPPVAAEFSNALGGVVEPSLPCVWASAASIWSISAEFALSAYLWAWAENQVLVGVKAVPLGQSVGQRVLFAVSEKIAALVARQLEPRLHTRPRSNFSPALAILSSRHETQYSRLFRS